MMRKSSRITYFWNIDNAASQLTGPVKVEMDPPGRWFPSSDELDDLTVCRFNNCDSKRLVSIHAYWRNVTCTARIIDDGGTVPREINADMVFRTWHDQYRVNSLASLSALQMRNFGTMSRTRRGMKKYHRIYKHQCHARACTTDSVADLSTSEWKNKTIEFDFFNKTGQTTATQTRMNADHWISVDNPEADATVDTKLNFTADLVIATKWRLYGADML